MKKFLLFVAGGLLLLIVLGAAFSGGEAPVPEAKPAVVATQTVTQTTAGVKAEVPAKPALTPSQEQAVREAESYLEYSGFSRTGLIEQLVFEEYSKADAKFAVDYLKPNWNAEAAESAKSYLDYSAFSKSGLIKQLKFEGFTTEQAEYGVKAAGL